MSDLRRRLEQETEKLKTRRDELLVQLDLGKKEVEDAWSEADEKWSRLEAQLHRLKREGEEALDEIGEAAELLVDEVKEGFKKMKSLL